MHDLKRVSYESHEVVYCPTCQTGGKVLADRRLSRLVEVGPRLSRSDLVEVGPHLPDRDLGAVGDGDEIELAGIGARRTASPAASAPVRSTVRASGGDHHVHERRVGYDHACAGLQGRDPKGRVALVEL